MRMTGKEEPVEVQVILASGKTLTFKTSLGDTISMQNVETQFGKGAKAIAHQYYTLSLTTDGKDSEHGRILE
jgi:hypothetical protein